jgi:hypothetical protein
VWIACDLFKCSCPGAAVAHVRCPLFVLQGPGIGKAAAQGPLGLTHTEPKPWIDLGLGRMMTTHLKAKLPRDVRIEPGAEPAIYALGADTAVEKRGHILPVVVREVEGFPSVTVVGAWPLACVLESLLSIKGRMDHRPISGDIDRAQSRVWYMRQPAMGDDCVCRACREQGSSTDPQHRDRLPHAERDLAWLSQVFGIQYRPLKAMVVEIRSSAVMVEGPSGGVAASGESSPTTTTSSSSS